MEIEMPFTGWSKKKIKEGKKTCTARRYAVGEEGDTFVVDRQEFRITRIEYLPLLHVRNVLFRCEGAASPEQFERIYRSQHSFWKWEEGEKVYVHYFEKVE